MPYTTARIKYIEADLTTPRVTVIAYVRQLRINGSDVDADTARYRRSVFVDDEREQLCYVWRDFVHGALVASVCERAALSGRRLTLEYEITRYGWRLLYATPIDEAFTCR